MALAIISPINATVSYKRVRNNQMFICFHNSRLRLSSFLMLKICESSQAGVPTKHATYQIVLPILYVYCFKGKFRVNCGRCGRVGLGKG